MRTSKRRSEANDSLHEKRQREGIYEIDARDPNLLARGMSSRYLSHKSPLNILSNDEIDRDLRHMEAYANACKAYSQQLYLYTNANVLQQQRRHSQAPVITKPPPTLPVRIDPEEEKRMSMLRKRIVAAEAEREHLEMEYLSLRATYVFESKKLEQTRSFVDGHLDLLQQVIQKRGKVVALQRVRVAMARDIKLCLEKRTKWAEQPKGSGSLLHDPNRSDSTDILDVWNSVEAQLKEAERDLKLVETKWTKQYKGNVVPWEAQTVPRTPQGMPLLLSQLSRAPDKGAAYGTNGIFGSHPHSMVWLEANLPKTLEGMGVEEANVKELKEEQDFLRSELQKERDANEKLQLDICQRRKRNDELSAMMSLLRSETEALVQRHNVLLETPEARAVSQDLHKRAVEEREKLDAQEAEEEQEGKENIDAEASGGSTGSRRQAADTANDGDDEGGDVEI